MFKNKKIISLVCAATLFSSLNAKELNLNELVDIALQNNTNIEVSKNQKEVKVQELNKAKSAYLPKVTASADIGEYDIQSNGVTQEGSANSLTLSANQLIYDFGKTSSSIEASEHNLDASSTDILSNKQETVLGVKKAYYDILNKYQQIVVAKESVKLDELQLSQAKAYFKAGVRTQIDVTNALLKLSNSKLKLVQSQYDLKISKTKLISILGKNISEELEVKVDNKDISKLSKTARLKYKELEELITIGLTKRPEIKKFSSLIKTNKASFKNADSQYYPRIDLNASYSDKNSDDIASLESEQTALLLNLKWDLFTGFTTKADKKISLSNLNITKKQLEQQKLEITQDITNSYYNLKQSYDSINIGILSLELAVKNLDLATQRYKAGLNDLLEVNDAKFEYTESKNTLINAYYTYLTNTASLEYSLGVIYEN